MTFETVKLIPGGVVMLDQRLLPQEAVYLTLKSAEEVIWAIKEMVVRGAPAIGVAAAMGLALGASRIKARGRAAWDAKFTPLCRAMAAARPTAVNLAWAVIRMERLAAARPSASPTEVAAALAAEAEAMLAEDVAVNQAMGRVGAGFVRDGATILTHCNAGALATGGYGTALGVIRAAVEAGKKVQVLADETRPFLQGARLTAWELTQDGIPVTVIPDSMAASLMAQGRVDLAIVGADRIARNGDVANKIGTYAVALAAKTHKVPFYVAAPLSTIDLDCPSGRQIPLEQRPPDEVTHIFGQRLTPEGVPVLNQAFDVTPARLVTAIFTEKGAARPPYGRSLKALFDQTS